MLPRVGFADALVTLAAFGLLAMSAPAQPDPAVQQALTDLAQAYSSTPICERVSVQIRQQTSRGQPRVSQAGYLIRYTAVPPDQGPPHLALELQQYQVDAAGGQLSIAHQRDPGAYFRTPIDAELSPKAIAGVLPPVPLPQLEIAAVGLRRDPGQFWTSVWPYAASINWNSVSIDPRNSTFRTLRGTFEAGSVTAALRGPRVHELRIDNTQRSVAITLRFTPQSGCEAGRRLIDTERRTPLASLLELRPRVGAVRLGEPLPVVRLSLADGAEWSVQDLLDPPPDAVIAGIPAAEHVVLVFSRVLPPGTLPVLTRVSFDDLGERLRRLRSAAFQPPSSTTAPADAPEQPPRFGFARVLVFNSAPPDEVMAGIQSSARAWGMRHTLWSATPADSLDQLAPGADAVVAIVDSALTLRAVLPVTPQSSTDAIEGQVFTALIDLGAPRGLATFKQPEAPPQGP